MIPPSQVEAEIAAYRLQLIALVQRYEAGETTTLVEEAQAGAEALVCLMEEAPLEFGERIDYLVDRYETPRSSCSN